MESHNNRYNSLRQAQSSLLHPGPVRIRVQRPGTPPGSSSRLMQRPHHQHLSHPHPQQQQHPGSRTPQPRPSWQRADCDDDADLPWRMQELRLSDPAQSQHQHPCRHQHRQEPSRALQQQQLSQHMQWQAQNQSQHQPQRSLPPPNDGNHSWEVEDLALKMQDGVSLGPTPQQLRQDMIHNEQMEEISCRFENVKLESRSRFMPYIL